MCPHILSQNLSLEMIQPGSKLLSTSMPDDLSSLESCSHQRTQSTASQTLRASLPWRQVFRFETNQTYSYEAMAWVLWIQFLSILKCDES